MRLAIGNTGWAGACGAECGTAARGPDSGSGDRIAKGDCSIDGREGSAFSWYGLPTVYRRLGRRGIVGAG